MARINITAPWIEYYHKVNELFHYDSDIYVIYDEENQNLKLYAATDDKFQALDTFFPKTMNFGNVILNITVIPPNGFTGEVKNDISQREMIKNLFRNNNAVSFIYESKGTFIFHAMYVVFAPIVVQYYADDLSTFHGYHSMLYQDIAKELISVESGIYFCTEIVEE